MSERIHLEAAEWARSLPDQLLVWMESVERRLAKIEETLEELSKEKG